MSRIDATPKEEGQLVWCPGDPSLGVGMVTRTEHGRVWVRFVRLAEDRAYTTRGGSDAILRYEVRAGDRVVRRDGSEARVVGFDGLQAGLARYELDSGDKVAESEILPKVRDMGPKARLESLNLVHPEVVRARMKGIKLAAAFPRPGHAAVMGARVQWLPHQIDVATRALENDKVRLLLADEVGLGKTVEAALILAGLRHEKRADRVLILTPKALCIQWLGEIYRKTHELLVLLDEERLEDTLIDTPDLNPFEAHQRIVMPTELVASNDALAAFAATTDWDLVIVDEAHHLKWDAQSGGNPAYRLVEALAERSRHLLLLTATPMALDPAEYHALLRLLDADRFDDPSRFEVIRERVATIRDLAREVEESVDGGGDLSADSAASLTKLVSDDVQDAEAVKGYLASKSGERERRLGADDVLELLRWRHGLADYVVRNRRGPVGGLPDRKSEVIMLEPTEMQANLIDVGESVMFELVETLAEPGQQHLALGKLLRALWATPRALIDILRPISPTLVEELAPHVGKVIASPPDADGLPTGDARLRWLVKLLKTDTDDKVLVFVETDIAVRALRDALELALGRDIAVFHKGLVARDQDRQVSWFRDVNGPQVMLSTEAGGEGRNFQFCNRVVLYDLPWRPATVEQRIGRIDRVGQRRDVHVMVPCFAGGYEAAVLKIMQESIGVLDKTVGGIDHSLEYVSARLADLMMEGAGVDAWKALYLDTHSMVAETRQRIEASADPILDHASFSPERVAKLFDRMPENLEALTESFVRGYANHSKLDIHTKTGEVVGVEGAPGAAGGMSQDSAYAATFSRTHGLDHEEVEFLSFGHPLFEMALEWATEANEASAALAVSRGFNRDGAVLVWRFEIDLPEDAPELGVYFEDRLFTLSLDEAGKPVPEFADFLDGDRPLDRMDSKPLAAAADKWRAIVNNNYEAATKIVSKQVADAVEDAEERVHTAMKARGRQVERQAKRRIADGANPDETDAQTEARLSELSTERTRLLGALQRVEPRCLAVIAVRLVKARRVSA